MEKNIIIPNDLLPDTIFVPRILDNEPHKVFNVMQKNAYGKHELVGKIYRENGKYIARDQNGNQTFKDTTQLPAIKKRFKEQGIHKESRMHEIEDLRKQKSRTKHKGIEL